MRPFHLAICGILLLCSVGAKADIVLQGEWVLTGMIYRGAEIPPLNPNLNLRWSFFSNGTERLYWDRKGEKGFCERFANYQITDTQIHEEVFAVNPLNSPECAKDPDMQVGRRTSSKIEIQEQKILLYLQMGDEELVYVLKQVL